jgi:hypothetical protein
VHRLDHVAGEGAEHLLAVLELDRVAQARRVEVGREPTLRHPHAVLAVRRDLARLLERGIEQLRLRNHRVEHPDPQRLVRVEVPAGEHQLGRAPRADQARQEVADADVAGGEPDADEDRPEARTLGGDPHVAGQREREPAADRRTVDRRDDRLLALVEREDRLGEILLHLVDVSELAHRLGARDTHVVALEVRPRAEAAPGSVQHRDADPAVAGDLVRRLAKLRHEPHRERVHPLGSVERHHGDFAPTAIDLDALHGTSGLGMRFRIVRPFHPGTGCRTR